LHRNYLNISKQTITEAIEEAKKGPQSILPKSDNKMVTRSVTKERRRSLPESSTDAVNPDSSPKTSTKTRGRSSSAFDKPSASSQKPTVAARSPLVTEPEARTVSVEQAEPEAVNIYGTEVPQQVQLYPNDISADEISRAKAAKRQAKGKLYEEIDIAKAANAWELSQEDVKKAFKAAYKKVADSGHDVTKDALKVELNLELLFLKRGVPFAQQYGLNPADVKKEIETVYNSYRKNFQYLETGDIDLTPIAERIERRLNKLRRLQEKPNIEWGEHGDLRPYWLKELEPLGITEPQLNMAMNQVSQSFKDTSGGLNLDVFKSLLAVNISQNYHKDHNELSMAISRGSTAAISERISRQSVHAVTEAEAPSHEPEAQIIAEEPKFDPEKDFEQLIESMDMLSEESQKLIVEQVLPGVNMSVKELHKIRAISKAVEKLPDAEQENTDAIVKQLQLDHDDNFPDPSKEEVVKLMQLMVVSTVKAMLPHMHQGDYKKIAAQIEEDDELFERISKELFAGIGKGQLAGKIEELINRQQELSPEEALRQELDEVVAANAGLAAELDEYRQIERAGTDAKKLWALSEIVNRLLVTEAITDDFNDRTNLGKIAAALKGEENLTEGIDEIIRNLPDLIKETQKVQTVAGNLSAGYTEEEELVGELIQDRVDLFGSDRGAIKETLLRLMTMGTEFNVRYAQRSSNISQGKKLSKTQGESVKLKEEARAKSATVERLQRELQEKRLKDAEQETELQKLKLSKGENDKAVLDLKGKVEQEKETTAAALKQVHEAQEAARLATEAVKAQKAASPMFHVGVLRHPEERGGDEALDLLAQLVELQEKLAVAEGANAIFAGQQKGRVAADRIRTVLDAISKLKTNDKKDYDAMAKALVGNVNFPDQNQQSIKAEIEVITANLQKVGALHILLEIGEWQDKENYYDLQKIADALKEGEHFPNQNADSIMAELPMLLAMNDEMNKFSEEEQKRSESLRQQQILESTIKQFRKAQEGNARASAELRNKLSREEALRTQLSEEQAKGNKTNAETVADLQAQLKAAEEETARFRLTATKAEQEAAQAAAAAAKAREAAGQTHFRIEQEFDYTPYVSDVDEFLKQFRKDFADALNGLTNPDEEELSEEVRIGEITIKDKDAIAHLKQMQKLRTEIAKLKAMQAKSTEAVKPGAIEELEEQLVRVEAAAKFHIANAMANATGAALPKTLMAVLPAVAPQRLQFFQAPGPVADVAKPSEADVEALRKQIAELQAALDVARAQKAPEPVPAVEKAERVTPEHLVLSASDELVPAQDLLEALSDNEQLHLENARLKLDIKGWDEAYAQLQIASDESDKNLEADKARLKTEIDQLKTKAEREAAKRESEKAEEARRARAKEKEIEALKLAESTLREDKRKLEQGKSDFEGEKRKQAEEIVRLIDENEALQESQADKATKAADELRVQLAAAKAASSGFSAERYAAKAELFAAKAAHFDAQLDFAKKIRDLQDAHKKAKEDLERRIRELSESASVQKNAVVGVAVQSPDLAASSASNDAAISSLRMQLREMELRHASELDAAKKQTPGTQFTVIQAGEGNAEEVSRLKEELARLQADFAKKEAELKENARLATEEQAKLRGEIEKLKAQIEEATKAGTDLGELKAQLAEKQRALEEASKHIEESTASLSALKDAHAKAIAENAAAIEAQKAALAKLTEQEAAIRERLAAPAELERGLKAREEELAKREQAFAEREAALKQQGDENATRIAELGAKIKKGEGKRQQIAELTGQLAQEKTKAEEITKLKAELEAERARIKQEAASQRAKTKELQARLEAELQKTAQTVQDANAQVAAAMAAKREKELQVQTIFHDMREDVEFAKQAMEMWKARALGKKPAVAATQPAANEKELAGLRAQIAQLRKELETAKANSPQGQFVGTTELEKHRQALVAEIEKLKKEEEERRKGQNAPGRLSLAQAGAMPVTTGGEQWRIRYLNTSPLEDEAVYIMKWVLGGIKGPIDFGRLATDTGIGENRLIPVWQLMVVKEAAQKLAANGGIPNAEGIVALIQKENPEVFAGPQQEQIKSIASNFLDPKRAPIITPEEFAKFERFFAQMRDAIFGQSQGKMGYMPGAVVVDDSALKRLEAELAKKEEEFRSLKEAAEDRESELERYQRKDQIALSALRLVTLQHVIDQQRVDGKITTQGKLTEADLDVIAKILFDNKELGFQSQMTAKTHIPAMLEKLDFITTKRESLLKGGNFGTNLDNALQEYHKGKGVDPGLREELYHLVPVFYDKEYEANWRAREAELRALRAELTRLRKVDEDLLALRAENEALVKKFAVEQAEAERLFAEKLQEGQTKFEKEKEELERHHKEEQERLSGQASKSREAEQAYKVKVQELTKAHEGAMKLLTKQHAEHTAARRADQEKSAERIARQQGLKERWKLEVDKAHRNYGGLARYASGLEGQIAYMARKKSELKRLLAEKEVEYSVALQEETRKFTDELDKYIGFGEQLVAAQESVARLEQLLAEKDQQGGQNAAELEELRRQLKEAIELTKTIQGELDAMSAANADLLAQLQAQKEAATVEMDTTWKKQKEISGLIKTMQELHVDELQQAQERFDQAKHDLDEAHSKEIVRLKGLILPLQAAELEFHQKLKQLTDAHEQETRELKAKNKTQVAQQVQNHQQALLEQAEAFDKVQEAQTKQYAILFTALGIEVSEVGQLQRQKAVGEDPDGLLQPKIEAATTRVEKIKAQLEKLQAENASLLDKLEKQARSARERIYSRERSLAQIIFESHGPGFIKDKQFAIMKVNFDEEEGQLQLALVEENFIGNMLHGGLGEQIGQLAHLMLSPSNAELLSYVHKGVVALAPQLQGHAKALSENSAQLLNIALGFADNPIRDRSLMVSLAIKDLQEKQQVLQDALGIALPVPGNVGELRSLCDKLNASLKAVHEASERLRREQEALHMAMLNLQRRNAVASGLASASAMPPFGMAGGTPGITIAPVFHAPTFYPPIYPSFTGYPPPPASVHHHHYHAAPSPYAPPPYSVPYAGPYPMPYGTPAAGYPVATGGGASWTGTPVDEIDYSPVKKTIIRPTEIEDLSGRAPTKRITNMGSVLSVLALIGIFAMMLWFPGTVVVAPIATAIMLGGACALAGFAAKNALNNSFGPLMANHPGLMKTLGFGAVVLGCLVIAASGFGAPSMIGLAMIGFGAEEAVRRPELTPAAWEKQKARIAEIETERQQAIELQKQQALAASPSHASYAALPVAAPGSPAPLPYTSPSMLPHTSGASVSPGSTHAASAKASTSLPGSHMPPHHMPHHKGGAYGSSTPGGKVSTPSRPNGRLF